MTRPVVLVLVFAAGLLLFGVGRWQWRRDRAVNAARDRIAAGAINDAELRQQARATR